MRENSATDPTDMPIAYSLTVEVISRRGLSGQSTPDCDDGVRRTHPIVDLDSPKVFRVDPENSPPLPDGADTEYPGHDDWEPAEGSHPPYRYIWSPNLPPADVRAVVCQYAGGAIATDGPDAPLIYLAGEPYSLGQASAICEALSQAAELIGRWTQGVVQKTTPSSEAPSCSWAAPQRAGEDVR